MTKSTIHIPPAALEAGKRWICRNGCGPDVKCAICTGLARAAFLAIVEAWPQRKEEWRDNITFDGKPIRYSVLILPLTEKQDDKA